MITFHEFLRKKGADYFAETVVDFAQNLKKMIFQALGVGDEIDLEDPDILDNNLGQYKDFKEKILQAPYLSDKIRNNKNAAAIYAVLDDEDATVMDLILKIND